MERSKLKDNSKKKHHQREAWMKSKRAGRSKQRWLGKDAAGNNLGWERVK